MSGRAYIPLMAVHKRNGWYSWHNKSNRIENRAFYRFKKQLEKEKKEYKVTVYPYRDLQQYIKNRLMESIFRNTTEDSIMDLDIAIIIW